MSPSSAALARGHGGVDLGCAWVDVSDGRRTCGRPHPRDSLELRHDGLQRSLHPQLCGARAFRRGRSPPVPAQGDVTVTGTDRAVSAHSDQGDVTITGGSGTVQASSGQGGVTIIGSSASRCPLQSGQGDVALDFDLLAEPGHGVFGARRRHRGASEGPELLSSARQFRPGKRLEQRGRQPGQRSGRHCDLGTRRRHRRLPLEVT